MRDSTLGRFLEKAELPELSALRLPSLRAWSSKLGPKLTPSDRADLQTQHGIGDFHDFAFDTKHFFL